MPTARTCRLVLSALVLLGLTGCSGEEPLPPICAVPPVAPDVLPPQGLLKVGHPVSLSVLPRSSSSCGPEPQQPTSVTAEIEGPDGERVEGQIELGPPGSPATLQFIPVRPGPHHVLIAFAQVGGIHQFDLHAAVDSSATAPTDSLPQSCTSLERTGRGTWICDTAVIRDGKAVRTFPGTRLAVAGDVLWVVANGGVQRYVDTGTDLVMTGSLTQALGAATFLLASPDELTVLYGASLALYTFSGGALASAGWEPWSAPSEPTKIRIRPPAPVP